MVVWNSAKNPPEADYKKFLVLVRAYGGEGLYHKIVSYAHDLHKVDEYDFCDKKGKSGWYDYDSEWGNYEISNVEFWMELPEPPEELKNSEKRNGFF